MIIMILTGYDFMMGTERDKSVCVYLVSFKVGYFREQLTQNMEEEQPDSCFQLTSHSLFFIS